MRLCALGLVFFSAALSHASFDLMLLGDNTNAATSGARVMRYDPQTGAHLGYFGAGFIAGYVTAIAADRASGRVWVDSGNGVTVFNYNTGAYITHFGTYSGFKSLVYNAATDTLSFGHGGGSAASNLSVYDGAGNVVATGTSDYQGTGYLLKPGTSTYFSWWADNTTGLPVRAGASNTSFARIATGGNLQNYYNTTSSSCSYSSAFYGDNFYGIGYFGTSFTLWKQATTSTGFTGSPNGTTLSMPSVPVTSASLMAGHGDLIYARVDNILYAYSANQNSILGQQTIPGISSTNIGGSALIIAPEPGTWAALGLGAIAVVRRKKRQ